jgi:hypothetical protein
MAVRACGHSPCVQSDIQRSVADREKSRHYQQLDGERPVPEAGRSVFIIPPADYKTAVGHVVILNDAAWRIITTGWQTNRSPNRSP